MRFKPAAGPRPLAPIIITIFLLLAACRGENNTPLPSLPAGVLNLSKSQTLSFSPAIAASGNVLYAAWTDSEGPQNMEVFLSRSGDGGASFSAPMNISQSVNFSGNPKLALSGSNLYVVWEEFIPTNTSENNETDIFYRRADDQNGTLVWDAPKNLSLSGLICGTAPKSGPCPSQGAAITAAGNNVYVAWAEATDYVISPITVGGSATKFDLINSDILMVQSFDGGVTFSPAPITLSGFKTGNSLSPSLNPALASSGPTLYVAWEDFLQPNSKILFRRGPDPANGVFFPDLTLPALIRSGSIKGPNRPGLAAEGAQVTLLWEGVSPADTGSGCPELDPATGQPFPHSEIFLIGSADQGFSFTDPDVAQSNLSNTPCHSNSGRIAVSLPSVYVAWEDKTPGTRGILFKKSADGGATFGAVETLSQTAGSASNAAIASSGTSLFAVWEDSTLGNLEIFFTRR
ncbi:MAG TPA: sialidase family protein [Candidatus Manganitrophaceae bacterium]|nr:sialidase family protein [Candidatus Manganitrophaceae bacterium]